MLLALIQVLLILLTVVWWIIVIQMILSWLVAFNVINTYNDFVRGLMRGLDRITRAGLPADPQGAARFRRARLQPDGRPHRPAASSTGCFAASPSTSPTSYRMSAERIDGRAFAARLRERVAEAVPAFADAAGRAPGLAVVLVGEDPASQVYVRSKGRATDRGRNGELRAPAARQRLAGGAARARRPAQRRRGGRRDPRPAAASGRDRRQGGDRGDRPGQGRRRLPSDQCRPPRGRRGGAGALHPARLPDASQGPARRPVGARGGGDRPLQHRRQADGAAPPRRELHRHPRPQPHPRPARGGPARRHRRRRGRPAGNGPGRLAEARARR